MPQLGLVTGRKYIRQIGSDYERVQSRIVNTLLRIDPSNYSLERSIKISKAINSEIERLDSIAARNARSFIRYGYDFGKSYSVTSLRALGREKSPTADPLADEQAEKESYLKTTGYLYRANASIRKTANSYLIIIRNLATQFKAAQLREFAGIAGVTDEEEQYILNYVDDAVIQSESRQAVARHIRDYLQKRVGEGNLIIVNNRRYKLKYYAEMVARTEMRAAQSMGVLTSCREYGNDLIEISDHGTETPICLPYEGQVFSISGTSDRFPQLELMPPFHPNCQHYGYPTSDEAVDFFARAA